MPADLSAAEVAPDPRSSSGSSSGLSSTEAAGRLATHGPNTVPTVTRARLPAKVLAQLRDPMIMLLIGAAALTALTHDLTDSVVIALVVVVNTTVGVVQEIRAERAVTALQAMAAPHARVRRDGVSVVVPTAELVPGDVLLLDAGDVVGADGDVVEAYLLQTDDSALTGESVPVPKPTGSTVSAGTTVTRGRGAALVTATGPQSSLGRIATMVAEARPGPTPLQRRLTRLGRQLTAAAALAAAAVLLLSLARGQAPRDAVVTAISLAVAAVPESLPAVLTLSLALGAHRMARQCAIARELRAVETLGSVTLLATDKTGTLTENRMVVERVWTPTREYAVSGSGYDPAGRLSPDGTDDPALGLLLRDVVLCNDADLAPPAPRNGPGAAGWRAVGDPTEAALVALARRGGRDVTADRAGHPRLAEVPFDSTRAWMVTAHAEADRPAVLIAKGAPEAVLPTLGHPPAAQPWADARATEGYRVLAVADGPYDPGTDLDETALPPGLALRGLVAMTDPPRAEVVDVLRSLDQAGIEVVVMTGDHPATAEAVARRVGLLAAGEPPDGRLYARVRPEHKLELVEGWQRQGAVVAVTGDGVNDGPALRTAAIGVAMGQGGTEVARQAADLVLTDDRLGTVVNAVAEGRRIQDNLRRFLRYALGGGLAEVVYMLLAPFLGFRVPLLPAQILWINMLTHGLPGVAMGAEPAAEQAMRRPPLPVDAPVIDRVLARRIGSTGALVAAVTVAAALVTRALDGDARTSAFLVLGLAQLGTALALRDPGAGRRNPFLTWAVAGAVLLQVAGAVLPPLQDLLGTRDLTVQVWAWNVALAAIPGLLIWTVRRLRRQRGERKVSASGRRGVAGTGTP